MSNSLWLGRLVISFGLTGRGYNYNNPIWFSFCYGSFFPHLAFKGNPFNNEVTEFGWYWLCFHGGITLWNCKGNWFWDIPRKINE